MEDFLYTLKSELSDAKGGWAASIEGAEQEVIRIFDRVEEIIDLAEDEIGSTDDVEDGAASIKRSIENMLEDSNEYDGIAAREYENIINKILDIVNECEASAM